MLRTAIISFAFLVAINAEDTCASCTVTIGSDKVALAAQGLLGESTRIIVVRPYQMIITSAVYDIPEDENIPERSYYLLGQLDPDLQVDPRLTLPRAEAILFPGPTDYLNGYPWPNSLRGAVVMALVCRLHELKDPATATVNAERLLGNKARPAPPAIRHFAELVANPSNSVVEYYFDPQSPHYDSTSRFTQRAEKIGRLEGVLKVLSDLRDVGRLLYPDRDMSDPIGNETWDPRTQFGGRLAYRLRESLPVVLPKHVTEFIEREKSAEMQEEREAIKRREEEMKAFRQLIINPYIQFDDPLKVFHHRGENLQRRNASLVHLRIVDPASEEAGAYRVLEPEVYSPNLYLAKIISDLGGNGRAMRTGKTFFIYAERASMLEVRQIRALAQPGVEFVMAIGDPDDRIVEKCKQFLERVAGISEHDPGAIMVPEGRHAIFAIWPPAELSNDAFWEVPESGLIVLPKKGEIVTDRKDQFLKDAALYKNGTLDPGAYATAEWKAFLSGRYPQP